MNPTNLLLGSTGFLLVVALLFSFTTMNQGKNQSSSDIAALSREVERLEAEKRFLEQKRQQTTPGIIFPSPTYSPSTPEPKVVEKDDTEDRMKAIQEKLDLLAEENNDLRNQMEVANQPAPEPLLPELDEEVELIEPVAEDPALESRRRLIKGALLQATVQAWDPDNWTIAIEPAARANFAVNDKLAIRRNDGILCTFRVARAMGSGFIGELNANLALGAPEIVPGDELIIPPAFDGKLD